MQRGDKLIIPPPGWHRTCPLSATEHIQEHLLQQDACGCLNCGLTLTTFTHRKTDDSLHNKTVLSRSRRRESITDSRYMMRLMSSPWVVFLHFQLIVIAPLLFILCSLQAIWTFDHNRCVWHLPLAFSPLTIICYFLFFFLNFILTFTLWQRATATLRAQSGMTVNRCQVCVPARRGLRAWNATCVQMEARWAWTVATKVMKWSLVLFFSKSTDSHWPRQKV